MIKIGVLYGGPDDEHVVSRASSDAVMRHLSGGKYTPVPIYITREGAWQMYGMPVQPREIVHHVSACLNTLHGHFGDDANIRQILESLRIPYSGSSPAVSAMALRKDIANEMVQRAGLETPTSIALHIPADITDTAVMAAMGREVHAKLSPPWVVETLVGSVGADPHMARTMEELLLAFAKRPDMDVIVTEYRAGKQVAVATIEHFRGESIYVTLPAGDGFSRDENVAIADAARTVHRALGVRDHAVHEFMVTPRTLYFTGTTTAPSFHAEAPLAQSIAKTGITMPDFLHHIVSLTLERK